jgi:hypothetical protein
MTDDGSYGEKGLVTDKLLQLLPNGIDYVLAIGPIPMMRAVADVTRGREIPTVVSLNSIMVDGTGMCGGCRVKVGNQVKFACVDGPDFDGHRVDFDDLMTRLNRYKKEEREAVQRWSENCRMTLEPDPAVLAALAARAAPRGGLADRLDPFDDALGG